MKYIYIDIETTGLDIIQDKLIELVMTDSDNNKLSIIMNPGKESSEDALSKHGYTTEFLSDKPKLVNVYDQIKEYFNKRSSDDYYLVGHNILRFDIPFLMEKFSQIEVTDKINLGSYNVLDTMIIEKHFYPMDLNSVYKRYLGTDIDNYHNAESDVLATKAIHENQMNNEYYKENDLLNMISYDPVGRIVINDKNIPVWGNFGKYKYQNKCIYDDINYLKWFMGLDNIPEFIKLRIANEQTKYINL